MRLFAVVWLLIVAVCQVRASTSHSITTFINAKWNVTPFALEVSEYLADENANLFWDFVDAVNELDMEATQSDDSKSYKQSLKVAEKLLSAPQVSLLKLSLSLHSLSPRVEAHQQIAQEVLEDSDCKASTFAVIGGKIACSIAELTKLMKSPQSSSLEIFQFDHIYPGSETTENTVILYGLIGTRELKKFHDLLRDRAIAGDVQYVLRHYVKGRAKKKVRLSGYGVELHLKSTEYKSQDDSPRAPGENVAEQVDTGETEVNGFDFQILKSRYPELSQSLESFRLRLLEKSHEIAPLKAWEFQELGLQAAHQIASTQSDEALHIIQYTAQNFPVQAKSLIHTTVDESFKKEMKHNIDVLGRNLNLQPPDAALFINGLFFDAETIDMENLLETLKSEMRSLDGLHLVGVRGAAAKSLIALDLQSSAKEFAIDFRDSSIVWINDIEHDSSYRRWSSSVMELLRPTFPGMLRNIRKNLFNLVLIVDPVTSAARGILKLAESFVQHSAPVRLGVVLDFQKAEGAKEEVYNAILRAFNYVTQKKSAKEALSFLSELYSAINAERDVTVEDIQMQLKRGNSGLTPEQIKDIIDEDSDYDYGRQLSMEFVQRLGSTASPSAIMNGVPLPSASLTVDDFEELVLTEIMSQTPTLQKAVYKGELTDSDDIVDYLMGLPHVMPRLNAKILSTDDVQFLDVSGKPHKDLENIKAMAKLSNSDMTATLLENVKYFAPKNSFTKLQDNQVHFVTLMVVADLMTDDGLQLFRNAVEFVKNTKSVRLTFVPNTEGSAKPARENLNNLVWAASHTLSATDGLNFVSNLIEEFNGKKADIPKSLHDLLSSTTLHMKMLRVYCQRVLKMRKSDSGVIINGRILAPLASKEIFTVEDFGLLERFSQLQYGEKIRKTLKDTLPDDTVLTSDMIVRLVSILVPRTHTKSRYVMPAELKDDHTVVNLEPKVAKGPFFEVVGVLDPASKGAQKLAPILILLRTVLNCHMKVYLCAVDKHSDMPVKNFYRYVVEPEIQFSADGKSTRGPIAKFTGLPVNSLLTQNLQVPENWLVEVVNSVYDLDNIKLADINGPVHSEYELEYLLLEGHCFDSMTGAPPRGLQFTLGTNRQPIIVDTIVMANLGYFQLKATPGAWNLRLRHGKSADIYDVTSADGPNTVHGGESTRVIISSLKSHVLKVKVTKKPDKQSADLLGDDGEAQAGIWDSITSSFGGGSDAQDSEVINVFSVASGHLYERLLRIMMVSTIKHTKSPVKFWFLKNYLSPQFIDSLPHMAKEYNVQYELVQYKWPRWLHQQTEKQRIIWGYKILFLDVLFPLDVKKIIFVDADAIVRADIKELHTMDLGGAPYAYTPFCDSRKEMEGFRFWKQGYWRNHLQGRRYHISALYVVDLKRFRKIAAGDRLRGQYQALSQDPNSLSNLDQDLPNNMIHQVAIKSLPQEWLWCETWCSDDGLRTAKVIDLCNNPQTKEAKLTAAQRIVGEWVKYDVEIKNVLNRADAELHGEILDKAPPQGEEQQAGEKDEL
ncbi:UDP-glucose:glycoprotein glucosyltransferase [Phlebotomus argentipes]|uniref:UDP-glucose:glycoprotein glucosyltransferase n=1 Tax=Phlebotomus argentipes TaxID=94469 RepID=UPI002892D528|nr:UDP-glucose:glycoprotein glucosyltransferase [Phlebotomus argentipes]